MDSLLDEAIAGSRAARDELTRRFCGEVDASIRRTAGAKMLRQFTAADLHQEVFLKVFRTLHTLAAGSDMAAFRARLFQTVQWVVAEYAKRGAHFLGESAARDAVVLSPQPSAGPVTLDDENQWLGRLAARLGPKYGDVILLRAKGRSFAEIAAALSEREATVRKRYQRAFQTLQDTIERQRRGAE